MGRLRGVGPAACLCIAHDFPCPKLPWPREQMASESLPLLLCGSRGQMEAAQQHLTSWEGSRGRIGLVQRAVRGRVFEWPEDSVTQVKLKRKKKKLTL